MNKSQARTIVQAFKNVKRAIEAIDALTDEVVENDCSRGTDAMQSAHWQNTQYFADSIRLERDKAEHVLCDACAVLGLDYKEVI